MRVVIFIVGMTIAEQIAKLANQSIKYDDSDFKLIAFVFVFALILDIVNTIKSKG